MSASSPPVTLTSPVGRGGISPLRKGVMLSVLPCVIAPRGTASCALPTLSVSLSEQEKNLDTMRLAMSACATLGGVFLPFVSCRKAFLTVTCAVSNLCSVLCNLIVDKESLPRHMDRTTLRLFLPPHELIMAATSTIVTRP